jgi:hypothetical protein
MQILKETGIDWREGRLITNLYMDQCVKVRLDQGETDRMFVTNYIHFIQRTLTNEALEGF